MYLADIELFEQACSLAVTGNLHQAALLLQQSIHQDPKDPEVFYLLGSIQMQLSLWIEAAISFRQALLIRPNWPEGYNNIGLIQAIMGNGEEAEAAFRQAIELNLNFPEAYNNLGIILREGGQMTEAEECLRQAIQLKPDYAQAYNNLGTIFTDTGRVEEATVALQKAIQLQPGYPDPYHNLGVLSVNCNQLAAGEKYFCKALELNPGYTQAEFSLATLYLLQGNLDKGWKKYDHSRMVENSSPLPQIKRWQGECLKGKTILLYHEQGLGDSLQFVRYAHLVDSPAARTVLWVQPQLLPLIHTSFSQLEVVSGEDISTDNIDYCLPLPSLPGIFHTTMDTIPQQEPYLIPSVAAVATWQDRLDQLCPRDSYKVGLVWAGNSGHHNDRNRSIGLDLFGQLLAVDGISWISLQDGERAGDVGMFGDKIVSFAGLLPDFAATAGLLANLDLVITVDTAVAHLAGGMGKPTWVLLPFAPDWRWQLDRDDCPWYPSVRLFRQPAAAHWPEVMVRLKEALAAKLFQRIHS
jgi:Flp pilus assembly protein TadD